MKQQTEYSVIISERAKRMLVSHAGFLGQVSPGKAERLVSSFEKAAQSLEFMPQRCPRFTGVALPKMFYRYILFEKRYMMVFRILGKAVYVDYILDCRQDPAWLEDGLF